MGINATLIGQIITFLILVFITLKYIWPPLSKNLQARRDAIAAGLTASEQAHHELEIAKKGAKELLLDAKSQAAIVIEQANLRAHQIEESGREEGLRIITRMKSQAEAEIQKSVFEARKNLLSEVSGFILEGTQKLLQHEMSAEKDHAFLAQISQEVIAKATLKSPSANQKIK